MKQLIWLMLFLCLLLNNNGKTQSSFNFKKIEGLNSNVVYGIMQDSKGFIWVSTDAGAAKYDGYKFTQLTIDDGLTDKDIFQIKEDADGRLWFLTNNGKPSIYNNGYIQNAENTNWLKAISPSKLAIGFHQLSDKTIWYCTLDTAYKIYNNQVVEKIGAPIINKNLPLNNIISSFIRNNQCYLLCNNGIYNTATKQLINFPKNYYINNHYSKCYYSNNLLYYFSTNKLMCYSFNLNECSIVKEFSATNIPLVFLNTSNNKSIQFTTTNTVFDLKLVNDEKIIEEYESANLISAIITDKEGNLWKSSLEDGLFFSKFNGNTDIEKVVSPQLPVDAKCISISNLNNTIFFGYHNSYFLNIKKGSPIIHKLKTQIGQRRVYQIISYKKDLFIVNNQGISKQNKHGITNGSLYVKYMAEAKEHFYLATMGGIFKIAKNNLDKIGSKTEQLFLNQLNNKRTNTLLVASNDSLWCGSNSGLYLLVKEKAAFFYIGKSNVVRASVSKIIKHKNYTVFSTDNAGIGIITKDSIYTIDKKSGLLSNICNSIFSYNDSVIWAATAKGINCIKFNINHQQKLQLSIQVFTPSSNFINTNINDIFQSNDSLLIATNDGGFIHKLSSTTKNNFTPVVYIESLKSSDTSFNFQPSIKLKHYQNNIKINFIALAYQAEGKLKYRYKLLPIDTGWHETSNTFVEYPYLNAGNYTFTVTAALPNGVFQKNVANIQFTIANIFWRETWFIIGVLLLFMILAFLLIRYLFIEQKTKLNLKNQQLEFEKQVAELEQQALRLQINPHFIFNAIYAIQGFYATGDIVLAKEYVAKLATLFRMILDAGRNNTISLENELKIVSNYIDLFSLKSDDTISYTIQLNLNTDASKILVPSMIIQPIVENALLHGIKPVRHTGKIQIVCSVIDEKLICTISDNGIGMKKSAQQKFDKSRESVGLAITQKRILMQYKKIPQEPVFYTEDLLPENEFPGTKVTLHLPLNLNV